MRFMTGFRSRPFRDDEEMNEEVNEQNIKDCPCCGGEAEFYYEDFGDTVWIQCTECGLATSRYDKSSVVGNKNGEQWAAWCWNMRHCN